MTVSEVGGGGAALTLDFGHASPASADRARPAQETFERAVSGAARAIDQGEALMAHAASVRDYDAATLIALQAGIYRYSEAVELVSKIVDHAGAAARTVLQSGNH